MSINVNSSYGKDYFLRTYYGKDRDARLHSNRVGMKQSSKAVADSHALCSALKDLEKVDYGNTKKDGELYNKFLAFISSYNNTMDSVKDGGTAQEKQSRKKLQKLAGKYQKELERLGVKVQKDGSLKMQEGMTDKFAISKMKELFGKDSDFGKEMKRYASKIYTASYQINEMSENAIDASV